MRDDLSDFTASFADAHGHGLAVGRGGTLPAPVIPQSNRDVLGIDLTHVIHSDDVAAAKGGNGGGGGHGGGGGDGGGGGGDSNFDPYTSGDAGAFNITVEFIGTWTQELYDVFVAAADFYSDLITGDLQDVRVVGGKGGPRTIDDIVISAELATIDGEGGILGQAGPTSIRTTGSLPATAIMQFDVADATTFDSLGLFDDIVLHEMGHSLGFGSLWDILGLVEGGQFTGERAIAESLAQFGTEVIAVEQDGGSGTAGSHWDDDTYANELMTGYIDDANYLSYMSAASYGDLGYMLAGDYRAVVDDLVLV